MKRCLLYILFSVTCFWNLYAQNPSVNYDYTTIAAMNLAYETQSLEESQVIEALEKIRDNYTASTVATAGIFFVKYEDRKALTDITPWISNEENYYYRRVYRTVSAGIIPKTIRVAKLMLKNPTEFMYWGQYLFKVLSDTKILCKMFESIVSNGRLSFSDINFLEFSAAVTSHMYSDYVNSKMKYKTYLEELATNAFDKFTKKTNVEDIIKELTNIVTQRSGNSELNSSIMDALKKDVVDNAISELTKGREAMFDGSFLPDDVNDLFQSSDYELEKLLTTPDSLNPTREYTQTFRIERHEFGSESICDYAPNTSVYSGDWLIFPSGQTYATTDQIMREAEEHSSSICGWSKERVDALNAQDDNYEYSYQSFPTFIDIWSGDQVTGTAYAYYIRVTKSWDFTEVLDEYVFDSYSMDLDIFSDALLAKLDLYNDNQDDGPKYTINTGPRKYYMTADETKLAGVDKAVISVGCSDLTVLGEGSTTYKCKTCRSSLADHAKTCSMFTTIDVDDQPYLEILDSINVFTDRYTSLTNELDALNNLSDELLRKLEGASQEVVYEIQSQLRELKKQIEKVEGDRIAISTQLRQYNEAYREAEDGEAVETDDYMRIPYLMEQMRQNYGFIWTDEGEWSGYTFTRHAKLQQSEEAIITFEASLELKREAKFFLGIRIHRAIIEIDWKCTNNMSSSQVVEEIDLSGLSSDSERTETVNTAISNAAQNYPDCEVSVEYFHSDGQKVEDNYDTVHLLWASDRMKIAQEVETRTRQLSMDLSMLEKYLHYKHNVNGWWRQLQSTVFSASHEQRETAAAKALHRWVTVTKDNRDNTFKN